jgi:hypothetical protein
MGPKGPVGEMDIAPSVCCSIEFSRRDAVCGRAGGPGPPLWPWVPSLFRRYDRSPAHTFRVRDISGRTTTPSEPPSPKNSTSLIAAIGAEPPLGARSALTEP